MRLMNDTRERCNSKKSPMPCRAYDIMRMMFCVRGQSSISQMNFLLHDSIYLRSMDSNPSSSCRMFEIMRINECGVEQKTVQCVNKFFCYSCFFHLACCILLSVALQSATLFEIMDRQKQIIIMFCA